MKNGFRRVVKMMRGQAGMAYRLEVGRTYRVDGPIVLCSVHSDDFLEANDADCKLEPAESPQFRVLEVRPKQSNGQPWYRVRLHDDREGWINCACLLGKEIEE